MVRLLVVLFVVLAAMVAYPWLAVAAGVGLVVAVVVASARARTRRRPRAIDRAGPAVTVDRRIALRRAWRELNSIERGVGLPPTGRGGPPV